MAALAWRAVVLAASTADGETGGYFRPIGGFPQPSPLARPPVRGATARR